MKTENNQEFTARVQVRNTDNVKVLHLPNEYVISIYCVLDTIQVLYIQQYTGQIRSLFTQSLYFRKWRQKRNKKILGDKCYTEIKIGDVCGIKDYVATDSGCRIRKGI